MNFEESDWGQYGLPSPRTVEIRNAVSALISAYFSFNGLDFERHLAIGAGFKCVVLELYAPLTQEQEIELRQIVARSIPSDHTFQIWKKYETRQGSKS